MITRVIAFHNGNINDQVMQMQKKVFTHFGIPLEQIFTPLRHPLAIDNFLKSEEWDNLLIFDIDCIPLNLHAYTKALDVMFERPLILRGNAQRSSHIKGSRPFVAPSYIGLTRQLWEKTGRFSFMDADNGDVGELFSREVEKIGCYIDLIMPTHVEVPKWQIQVFPKNIWFGLGTTFGDTYHSFESRENAEGTDRFLAKCKHVLNAYS